MNLLHKNSMLFAYVSLLLLVLVTLPVPVGRCDGAECTAGCSGAEYSRSSGCSGAEYSRSSLV